MSPLPPDDPVEEVMRLIDTMPRQRVVRPRSFSKRKRYVSHAPTMSANAIAAFDELASLQRGEPEAAMLEVQHALGGGILSGVVEHTGDLIHRMSEMSRYGHDGREYVLNKTEKVLRYLTQAYGFEREHEENLRSNARFHNISYEEQKHRVDEALKRYAEEHAKLPVYNRAQWLAREASVAVGKKNWTRAVELLRILNKYASDQTVWTSTSRGFAKSRYVRKSK